MRILYGHISADAQIVNQGSGGWRVRAAGTGRYAIDFDHHFATPVVVTATLRSERFGEGPGSRDNTITVDSDVSHCSVRIWDDGGSDAAKAQAEDGAFYFMALGD